MNLILIVLIAAVMVNCLVTTINGKTDADTLAVPYIDTLLPPLEDVQDNSSKDASAKINTTTKATAVYKTTTKAITSSTTKSTTTTTQKPINNDENNILPQPSIEALLPPLFEAKIEKVETIKTTTTTTTTTKSPTSTTKTTTTITTKRPTTGTTKHLTTTAKPTTATKPNLKVPDLFLDPLQPPLFDTNNSAVDKNKKLPPTTTTQPKTIISTTNNAQKIHKQQETKYIAVKTTGSKYKNKPALKDVDESQSIGQQIAKPALNHKHAAETQSLEQKVTLTTLLSKNNKLQSKTDKLKQQNVAKEKVANTKFVAQQFNKSFDLYFRGSTLRPTKSGLPTITPFPHRLGK